MADRARVTYTGTGPVDLPGSAEATPVDTVRPGDTVEVTAAYAAQVTAGPDPAFTRAAVDVELVDVFEAFDTPPAAEPRPLDQRREDTADALEAVDGDVTRLRGEALNDALRAALGSDADVSGSLAERQERLAAAAGLPSDTDGTLTA